MSQRFGLWALDVQTQIRTKRKSAELYSEIAEQRNHLEAVEKHPGTVTFIRNRLGSMNHL